MRRPNLSSVIAFGSLVLVLAACGGGSGTTNPVIASAYSFPSGKGGQVIDPSFSAVEGDKFAVTGTKNVIVTSLGVEHAVDNQTDRQVGLFDGSGNLIVSTTVSTTDPLIDGYHYKTITPVTLTPGSQYFIGALHVENTNDSYIWDTNTATTASYIQDLGTYYSGAAVIVSHMTFNGPGGARHYSANFQSYQQDLP